MKDGDNMTDKKNSPWQLFEESSKKYGNNICVINNKEILTYNDMLEKINEFSDFIKQYDFKMCSIFLPNSSYFICTLFALNKLNRVSVPLSFQLKGESLVNRIAFSDSECIITDLAGYQEIKKIKENITVKMIIVINDYGNYIVYKLSDVTKEINLENDIFGIFFTSGSTSEPKGVVTSNSAVCGNAVAEAELLNFNEKDRYLVIRSFSQIGPISGDILMPIYCGAAIVVMEEFFHPGIFLNIVEKFKVTSTFLVCTMLNQILSYPRLKNFDISSLKIMIMGGMPTPPNVRKEAAEKIPTVDLHVIYGMSEASVKITFLNPNELLTHAKSSGQPLNGVRIKILSYDGKEVPEGELGEIYIDTDYAANGYYKKEDLTKNTFTKYGIRTKDLGYLDSEGRLYIVGRADDVIIQGGNNIYPMEIKEVLLKNSEIKEAEVFGMEDKTLGSKIVSLVRLKENSVTTVQDIHKWCRQNLEYKKIPKEVYIVDEMPKTSFGKITKTVLTQYVNNINAKF